MICYIFLLALGTWALVGFYPETKLVSWRVSSVLAQGWDLLYMWIYIPSLDLLSRLSS